MHNLQTMVLDEQAAFAFVTAQGREIEAEAYKRRYPELDYANHVPIVTQGNPWAIGTQFRLKDYTGQAKIISGKAADIPFVKGNQNLGTHDHFMIGAGWEWSEEEVAQGMMYDLNPVRDDAESAIEVVERLLNDIFISGSDEANREGLTNSSLVQRTDAASQSGSTFWPDKDVDHMVADVNAGLEAIRSNSNEIEWGDTVRLPPIAFREIATRRLGSGDGAMTALDYLRKANIYTQETGRPLDITPLRQLATASQDGGGRLIAYRKDPKVLRGHLPMPRRVLQVHRAGMMHYQQGVISRTGGTEIRLPSAMAYIDEITDVPS